MHVLISMNVMNMRRQVNHAVVVAVLRFSSINAYTFSRLGVVSVITKRGVLAYEGSEAASENDAV